MPRNGTDLHKDVGAFAKVPEADQCAFSVEWLAGNRVLVCGRKMGVDLDGKRGPHPGDHLHLGNLSHLDERERTDVWFGNTKADGSGEWRFYPREGEPAKNPNNQYTGRKHRPRPDSQFADVHARLAKAATAMKKQREKKS